MENIKSKWYKMTIITDSPELIDSTRCNLVDSIEVTEVKPTPSVTESEEEPIGTDCQCELGSKKHYHPDCEYLKEDIRVEEEKKSLCWKCNEGIKHDMGCDCNPPFGIVTPSSPNHTLSDDTTTREEWEEAEEIADEVFELLPPNLNYKNVKRKSIYNWLRTRIEGLLLSREQWARADERGKLVKSIKVVNSEGIGSSQYEAVEKFKKDIINQLTIK